MAFKEFKVALKKLVRIFYNQWIKVKMRVKLTIPNNKKVSLLEFRTSIYRRNRTLSRSSYNRVSRILSRIYRLLKLFNKTQIS